MRHELAVLSRQVTRPRPDWADNDPLGTGDALQLAAAAEPHLRGSAQIPWLSRLTAEHDNLLMALNAACDMGDGSTAVRPAAALGTFWTVRGWLGCPRTGPPACGACIACSLVFPADGASKRQEDSRQRLVIGSRRSLPKLLAVIFGPGGYCRRPTKPDCRGSGAGR